MTFSDRKFTGLLGASTVVIVAEYILVLSDSVIAGRILGETALGAVNLLMPLFSCVSFFTWLLAVGTAIVCSDAIGRLQHDRAARLAGQGMVAAVGLGVLLAAVIALSLKPFFAFMAPDATTSAFAADYGRWYVFVAALEAVDMFLMYIVYAYGGEKDCILSYLVQTIVNVALSYALCAGCAGLPEMGMAGIAIGTVIAYAAGIAVLLPAVIGRRGGLRFIPCLLPREFLRSLKASFGDASAGLFHALLFLIVNKYCICRYGPDSLPIIAVVFCIVRLTVFFNGVGIALQPLETVYHGEGNDLAVRRLVRYASFFSVAEGALLSGLILIAPELVVSLIGIVDEELFSATVHAVRLTVVGLIGYAIVYLLNSHYQYIGRPNRSITLTATAFLAVPTGLLFLFGAFFGMTGVYLAVAVGPLVALAAFLPAFRRPDETAKIRMWSVRLGDYAACAGAVNGVAAVIAESEDVSAACRRLSDVLLLAFRRMEHANAGGKRRVFVEVSLLFGTESVQLVIRDDGVHIPLDDLGMPVVHLPAAGFNRNVFSCRTASKCGRLRGKRSCDSRYCAVRGMAATEADFREVIALDGISFDDKYQVQPEQDRELFLANRENGLIVKDKNTGEVVAYAMILPLKEEVYQRIRAGEFIDTELTKDMVQSFDRPGEYRVYFASVAIHPRHRGASLLLAMIDFMVEDFIALAERGIFARTLTADVVSREGEKMAQLLGLKEVCRSNHGSRIFEATTLPPELRETTASTERLVGIYWEEFVRRKGARGIAN